MKVIRDDLWLCTDCLFGAVNDDYTGCDLDETVDRVKAGLKVLGPGLVPDFDSESPEQDGILEFSRWRCDCCRSSLGGSRHRFAVLGE